MRGGNTILFMLLIPLLAAAGDTTKYANPSVNGIPNGKGLEVRYEQVSPFSIRTHSREHMVRPALGEVRKNERFEAKLKFPVINRPSFKVILGGNFFTEEYYFENTGSAREYPLYRTLHDKSLKVVGTTAYVLKSFDERRFALLRASFRLQGDFNTLELPWGEFARYNFAMMYGWKKNENTVLAPGISYNDVFGRRSIFPVFLYNHTFNNRWGLETTLPVEVKLRYNQSPSSIFYLKTEANGAKYNIHLQDNSYPNSVYLEQSEARLTLALEQRLFSWVWVNLEGGVRENISYKITNRDALIDNRILQRSEVGFAALVNGSIFIRPSRID